MRYGILTLLCIPLALISCKDNSPSAADSDKTFSWGIHFTYGARDYTVSKDTAIADTFDANCIHWYVKTTDGDTVKIAISSGLPDSAFPAEDNANYFVYYPVLQKLAKEYLKVEAGTALSRDIEMMEFCMMTDDSTVQNYVFKPILKPGFSAQPESLVVSILVMY